MKTNSDTSIEMIKAEHRSLAILCAIEKQPGYTLNDHVLKYYLDAIGLGSAQDDLRVSLKKLENIGLIRLRSVEDIVVMELTQEGLDTALGKQISENVLKRAPDCPY